MWAIINGGSNIYDFKFFVCSFFVQRQCFRYILCQHFLLTILVNMQNKPLSTRICTSFFALFLHFALFYYCTGGNVVFAQLSFLSLLTATQRETSLVMPSSVYSCPVWHLRQKFNSGQIGKNSQRIIYKRIMHRVSVPTMLCNLNQLSLT